MILHIDLDCFFVAAARIKDRSLVGKRVAVVGGGSSKIFGDDDTLGGVVLSASYEAREFGIRSAMPLRQAQRLCKDLVLVKADHAFYKELSNKLFKFLYRYTPDIEQFSIDEFFLDLSGIKAKDEPIKFAKMLQNEILNTLNLPCSIGLSDAKYLAKLSTSLAKPFGVRLIMSSEIDTTLKNIEISKFPGAGKSASKVLNKHGIFTLGDVRGAKQIFTKLGKNYIKLYENITGTGSNELEIGRVRKSFSHGRTFAAQSDREEVKRRVLILCRYLNYDIHKFGQNPTKFDLKIRYEDRETISRALTYKEVFSESLLHKAMSELFLRCDIRASKKIIYVSVGAGGFVESVEKTLFSDKSNESKKIDKAVQSIREKYGIDSLIFAKEIKD
ncbi:MAG: DNA polymerase IV [Campylobacteraceae bacterium]|nr:DNA polymerase IV [Campylobacteraceae bacterium]